MKKAIASLSVATRNARLCFPSPQQSSAPTVLVPYVHPSTTGCAAFLLSRRMARACLSDVQKLHPRVAWEGYYIDVNKNIDSEAIYMEGEKKLGS